MTRHPRWYDALNKALQEGEPNGTGILQMATIDSDTPRVRSLVHRGFVTAITLPTLPLILVTTDIRTPKVMQMYHQQCVEVVYWMERRQEQYRILGRASIVPRMSMDEEQYPYPKPQGIVFDRLEEEGFDWEKKRVAVFDSMSAHMKATWCRPVPGTPLESEDEMKNWPEKLPKLGDAKDEKGRKNLEMALSNFALLLVEPLEVDFIELLQVDIGRDRRTNFKRESDRSVEFKETLLVP